MMQVVLGMGTGLGGWGWVASFAPRHDEGGSCLTVTNKALRLRSAAGPLIAQGCRRDTWRDCR